METFFEVTPSMPQRVISHRDLRPKAFQTNRLPICVLILRPSIPLSLPCVHLSRCLRCVVCNKRVLREIDAWSEAPPGRLYHDKCWERNANELCRDDQLARKWHAGQKGLTQVEMAHLLHHSIRNHSTCTMRALLDIDDSIKRYPLPGIPDARYCAAASGNLDALKYFLETWEGDTKVLDSDWEAGEKVLFCA